VVVPPSPYTTPYTTKQAHTTVIKPLSSFFPKEKERGTVDGRLPFHQVLF